MPEKKVTIDIDINSDALNQLPKYKAGFDNLRDAVNNLNKEIGNSAEKLSKLNAQQKEADNWGTKIKKTVKELNDTYKAFNDIITTAATALSEGWVGAISVAFTLITTYGPQVLEYLGEMFQSDRTKEAAKNLKNYNEMMTSYIENVSGGLAKAEVLIGMAKNESENWNNRAEAIKKLIAIAPEYLKNLTVQNVNTKEGRQLLDEYTKSLKRAAIEEAAQAQTKPLIVKRLQAQKELINAQKLVNEYESGKKEIKTRTEPFFTGPGMGSARGYQTDSKEDALKDLEKKKQIYNKIVREIAALQHNTNQGIVQFVAKPILNKTHNKEYWENELNNWQTALSKLDSGAKNFEAQSKPIVARIKQAQKMLQLYDVGNKTQIHVKASKTQAKTQTGPDEAEVRRDSADRMALLLLQGYEREMAETNIHFDKLVKQHQGNAKTVEQIEKERVATLRSINQRFYDEGLTKLTEYENQLNQTSKTARQQAFDELKKGYEQKQADVAKIRESAEKVERNLQNQIFDLAGQNPRKLTTAQIEENQRKIAELEKQRVRAEAAINRAKGVTEQLKANEAKDTAKLTNTFSQEDAKENIETDIAKDESSGNWQKAFEDKQKLLDFEKNQALNAENLKESEILNIKKKYKDATEDLNKAKQDAELANQKKYLQSISNVATAVTGIFGKNTIAARLAFKAQQAAAAAQVIIETKKSIMNIWSANSGIPFVGVPKAIAETAMVAAIGASNLASIIKQKPGFAQGGQYVSDGRGAVLSGYSRTDNTNAYLRSGEGVVVSEAMRNPWARNLVSAINVAHGGRDFSVPNPGRGYAVGGIFTDGGNASRYYSQPLHDQKDLANTLAYQLINNFPPIYVDVKDVNNQQSILAQTVDRVNL